jgi:hypothetical protein
MAPPLKTPIDEESLVRIMKGLLASELAPISTSINQLRSGMADVKEAVKDIERALNDHDRRLTAVENNILEVRAEMCNKEKEFAGVVRENKTLQQEVLVLQRHSRSWNVRVLGVPEPSAGEREDTVALATSVFAKCGITGVPLDTAHRVPGAQGRARPLLIRLARKSDRWVAFSHKKEFYSKGMALHDDLPAADRAEKAKYQDEMNAAYSKGKRPRFAQGKWHIDGKVWNGN